MPSLACSNVIPGKGYLPWVGLYHSTRVPGCCLLSSHSILLAYKKLEIDRKIELVTGRYIETKSDILGQKDSKCICSRERKRCIDRLEERHISFYVKNSRK